MSVILSKFVTLLSPPSVSSTFIWGFTVRRFKITFGKKYRRCNASNLEYLILPIFRISIFGYSATIHRNLLKFSLPHKLKGHHWILDARLKFDPSAKFWKKCIILCLYLKVSLTNNNHFIYRTFSSPSEAHSSTTSITLNSTVPSVPVTQKLKKFCIQVSQMVSFPFIFIFSLFSRTCILLPVNITFLL